MNMPTFLKETYTLLERLHERGVKFRVEGNAFHVGSENLTQKEYEFICQNRERVYTALLYRVLLRHARMYDMISLDAIRDMVPTGLKEDLVTVVMLTQQMIGDPWKESK
jgi:hypothetical protein